MQALNGYVNGDSIIVEGNLSFFNGRQVIVTILDQSRENKQTFDNDNKQKIRDAAIELAGLWEKHDNSITVDEMVRGMRKGRTFDI